MVTNDNGGGETKTRGILSDADKRYLRDPEAYADLNSRAAIKKRHEAIRDRTRRALADFATLAEHMDDDRRREIFPVSRQDDGWGNLREALVEMLAFVHLGVASKSDLEKIVADGVRRGELYRGTVETELHVHVDCEIDITHSPGLDLHDIADRLDAGEYEDLPPGVGISFLQTLIVAGVLDPQQAVAEFEAIQDRMGERQHELYDNEPNTTEEGDDDDEN